MIDENNLAGALIRFEAARALLGHAAVASPAEIREAVDSVPRWVEGPMRTAWVLSRIGAVWERRRREAFSRIPVPPVIPVLNAPGEREDGAVVEHTTMTGRTRLVVRPSNVVGAGDQWRVTMERDVPVPLHDARRLAVAVLVDDIDALTDEGLYVDVIPSRPQAARRDDWADRVADAAVQLRWLARDGRVPSWASEVAAERLRAYAPVAEQPGRARRRLVELLSELNELDGRLTHTPEDQSPEWGRRNQLVREAAIVASQCGMLGGWDVDPEADSGFDKVIYLYLPQGGLTAPRQVSWHVPHGAIPVWWPIHSGQWDGHSREEKAARIAEFLDTQA